MTASKSVGTFVIQPRPVEIWGGPWHAMAFTLTGTGGALYNYVVFLGFGAEGALSRLVELAAIGLVFLGALIIFALELTHRSVFLRYFFANIGRSWISRGVIALFIFGILSVVSVLLGNFNPGTETLSRTLTIITALAALVVIVYPSLLLSTTSVPFWRSWLLPLEFLVSGGIGGLAIIVLLQELRGVAISLGYVLIALGSLLAANFLLHLIHLTRIPIGTKRQTIELLTRGELRSSFLMGFVVLGTGIPLVLVIVSYLLEDHGGKAALLVIGTLALIGIFNQRYWLFKAGIKPALL